MLIKNLDQQTINGFQLKLFTWNNENESIKLINDVISHYCVAQNWRKFIREGSNTIDIGAHSGDTLIPLLLCGSNYLVQKTKILAIEPNPFVKECCELNAYHNASTLVDIKVLPFAVTCKDNEQVVLFDHGNNMCNGGIIHEGLSDHLRDKLTNISNKKEVKCTGMTLQTICADYFSDDERDNISFIKIDTEGYDREIIASSKEFLNKYRPVVFIEWFDFYNEEDSKYLFIVIENINYIPFNPVTLEVATVTHKIWDLLLIHKEDTVNLKKTKIFTDK